MCGPILSGISSMFGSSASKSPATQLPAPPSQAIADQEAVRQRAVIAKKQGRGSTLLAGKEDTGYTPMRKKLLGE